MNRHAKAAQVKAETNFKISEDSKVWFGMGTVYPKGGVEVTDVIEKQKLSRGRMQPEIKWVLTLEFCEFGK